jgi:hypothetical protein
VIVVLAILNKLYYTVLSVGRVSMHCGTHRYLCTMVWLCVYFDRLAIRCTLTTND